MTKNNLWAPWRMGYLKNIKKEKGCLFCRVFKSNKDADNLLLHRSTHAFSMLNLYPYNNGHLMVAPVRHVPSLEMLGDKEICDCLGLVTKTKRLLDRVLKPDGYNIGINIGRAGGAGFDRHLHIHIVPRWFGDTNFMPTLAGTRIISQSLKALYQELSKHKDEL